MGITTRACINTRFLEFWHEDKIFLKSLEKDFHGIFDKNIHEDQCDFAGIGLSSPDEHLMYSEVIDIKEDDHGKKEYRIYFIQGRISISRYGDYKHLSIPAEITGYAKELQNEVVGKNLPENIIIDICESNRGIVVVECNSPCSAGRYIDNTVESLFGLL